MVLSHGRPVSSPAISARHSGHLHAVPETGDGRGAHARLPLRNGLWLCVCLPRLETDVFDAGPDIPLVVTEVVRGRILVCGCNKGAEKHGIRPSMSLTSAQSLCAGLQHRSRDEQAECARLNRVALTACGFSGEVSFCTSDSIVLEIGASLKLFGGLANLLRRAREAFSHCDVHFVFAVAPTGRAASWLAQYCPGTYVQVPEQLAEFLRRLPARAVTGEERVLQRLQRSGIRTVGALLRLPRAGVARRFGPELLQRLDQALGRTPDLLPIFSPPTTFQVIEELYPPPSDWLRLQPAAASILQRLEHFLLRQQAATRRVLCRLWHERTAPTVIELNTSRYERRAPSWLDLLHKHFERTVLPAPVAALDIRCEDMHVIPHDNLGLLNDHGGEEQDWQELLDRFAARLGGERLSKPRWCPDHRPERAAGNSGDSILNSREGSFPAHSVELSILSPEFPLRPVWLLTQPQLLRTVHARPDWHGPLVLSPMPERIEQGWWDGEDVCRDYFRARNPGGSGLWLFQNRRDGRWYLHGVFS